MLRLFVRKRRVVERQNVVMTLADGREIAVALHRHPRARRIKLSVDERGVRLTLPPRASEGAGLEFLHAQRDWLARQLAALAQATAFDFRIGEAARLPLRDGQAALRWQPARLTRIVPEHDGLRFDVRGLETLAGAMPTPAVRRALRDFFEAEARADIARWLPEYAAGLPRPPARIVLKRPSSQWGSLSVAGAMTLDLSLVIARPQAFEYVLVHELCHLLHHDHSRAFWREVASRCPDWRVARDYLRAEGPRLKATMRTLTG
ncbi:M48 family peptidase [Lysobacter pythonis]|uniref:M48 family peptidase n=1 Tax=Solilutibacter pythonis TaxID=2483112 RepID=A0A3M2HDT6_9GAMM|nr:SprT family zinc-dependent metalloprotease [Lysobacter pythonis]RMH87916.1 M48 family peptidase [Lysobacter pythonis]